MIWAGRRAEAAGEPVLGDEVWAAKGRLGPVPPGWVGLRVLADGHCVAWVAAGQALPKPRRGDAAGVVWWVRAGAWPLRFALWPELAPEAGLALMLELDDLHDGDRRDLLASSLAQELEDVRAQHWAERLRQQAVLIRLPPCATGQQLAYSMDGLSRAFAFNWLVRVTALQRCDLCLEPPGDEEPAAIEGLAEHPALQTVGPAGLMDVALGSGASVSPAPMQGASHWPVLVAQDRLACQSLARGLPVLALDLQRRWVGGGWSDDLAVAGRQRSLSQRLGLLASKLGAWPALEPDPLVRLDFGLMERRMVGLQSVRAIEALAQVEAALHALPAAGRAPAADDLGPLEQALELLEAQVQARLLPWWR